MEEANKLQNKNVQEFKVLIFSLIEEFHDDAQKSQEDLQKDSEALK